MGVAYFLVFEKEVPGFETCFEGKAVARAIKTISAITEKLGLKAIDELTDFSRWDRVLDVPEEHRQTETPWFEPQEGVEWVSAIRQHIESNRSLLKEPDRVMEDLDGYTQVLRKAAKIGARWHFEMDA